ncbi:MAG: plastocyanin [Candidatus Promineifilaceae bacterium]|jgi:plastocyanin
MTFSRLIPCATCLALLIVAWSPTPLIAASVYGIVRAQGKPVPLSAQRSGKYKSRKHKFTETVDYTAMKEFVVSIEGPLRGDVPQTPAKTVQVVVQRDARFDPRVMVIEKGTTVEWPNKDDIFHNVFSASETKPFDLGLYKEEIKSITFEKPGRVDVFCSIHKNMSCIILVMDNPYYSKTDNKNRYRIDDIRPGTYTLKAWHERLPPQTRKITITEDGDLEVDLLMGITGLPQY